jgi:Secretion system C-terminal sorting domain
VFPTLSAQVVRTPPPRISYILPDICAPGMNTAIEIIGPGAMSDTLNFGADGIYTNNPGDSVRVELVNAQDSSKVVIGPIVVSWKGRMISTQIFVLPNVVPNSKQWSALSNDFRIPLRVVVSGRRDSVSNADTVYIVQPFQSLDDFVRRDPSGTGRIIGEVLSNSLTAQSARSRRGAMIVNSIDLDRVTYNVSTLDCDPLTEGNQGYLPLVILAKGKFDGGGATINANADGRNGGAGGGGGGGRATDLTGNLGDEYRGGNGYTGGAGGGRNLFGSQWLPGGEGTGPADRRQAFRPAAGASSLNDIAGGLSSTNGSNPQSAGGGTGHPFGKSGRGWLGGDNITEITAGGGNGQGDEVRGDGGGYGTQGTTSVENGGGQAHGNIMVVPIAGGSGGASGNPRFNISGYGGGGGGAVRIAGESVLNLTVQARGARGSSGQGILGMNGPSGGDGSGGHVSIQSKLRTERIVADVSGSTVDSIGAGRMRFDVPNNFITYKPSLIRDYTAYFGVTLDPVTTLQSPYTTTAIVKGFAGVGVVRFYHRSLTGRWQISQERDIELGTSVMPGFQSPVTGAINFTPTRQARLTDQDSTLFVVAVLGIAPNLVEPPKSDYELYPLWTFSQAAASILRVTPLPFIRVDSSRVNLPTLIRCGTEERQITSTFAITNARGGTLNVRSIEVIGANASFFTVNTPSSFNLQQNQSRVVQVTFKATGTLPPNVSTFSVQLQIFHNDTLPDIGGDRRTSPQTVDVTAVVQNVRFAVSTSLIGATASEPITPSGVDFGRIAVGDSVQRVVVLTNTTSPPSPLRFTISTTRPRGTTPFSVENRSVVPPLTTVSVPITFRPTAIGAAAFDTVFVRVQNEGGICQFDSTLRIALRGTGVLPRLDTTRTSPVPLDFGTFTRCFPATTGGNAVVQIANSGNDDLDVSRIRMSNPASPFTPVTQRLTVRANNATNNATGDIAVNFTAPTSTQASIVVRDTLLLETNDIRYTARSPYRIPVVATLQTVLVRASITPQDSLNFGEIRYFSRVQRPVTITNTGNTTLNVSIITPSSPFRVVTPSGAPVQSPFLIMLAPNAVQTLLVEVLPTEAQRENVQFSDALSFNFSPTDGMNSSIRCPFIAQSLRITATPRGPVAVSATLWLDTLGNVDMLRDTTVRIWGRTQTLASRRSDTLRAGFRVRRGMFLPTNITSSFGTARIESSVREPSTDRVFVVSVPNVILSESTTLIATITGTPILTDTMRSVIEWIPAQTRWVRGDSVYRNDALGNGLLVTTVCLPAGKPRLFGGTFVRTTRLANVQPNPTQDAVTLTIDEAVQGAYTLDVVNILGERVVKDSWTNAIPVTTSLQRTVSLQSLPSGMYTLVLRTPSGQQESRLLVIER